MDVKYQVFVSSTYTDLKDEREAVIKCLLDNDCIPVGMEQFHGVPIGQWEYITKMLDNSDYCVLILAGKYGSIEESGIGYTEKEFDYAIDKNIPVIRLLYKDLDSLSRRQTEIDADREKKLLAFRKKVMNDILVDFYENLDDLKIKTVTAINKAIKHCPRPGWVRNDSVNFSDNSPKSNNRSEEEIRQLVRDELNANTTTDEEFNAMIDEILNRK